MSFGEPKYIEISTLRTRWSCSRDVIYDLISEGSLRAWHPRGHIGKKGIKVEVKSVLEVEQNGYLEFGS